MGQVWGNTVLYAVPAEALCIDEFALQLALADTHGCSMLCRRAIGMKYSTSLALTSHQAKMALVGAVRTVNALFSCKPRCCA
jgi:hypothetical protein